MAGLPSAPHGSAGPSAPHSSAGPSAPHSSAGPGFRPDDLIQLPRFDAAGAIALGEKLLAAAATVAGLPRAISRARDTLEIDLANLRAAAAARMAARMAERQVEPERVAAADDALDACWTALFEWLTAFTKLPGGRFESEEARTLLSELYPEGLGFIRLPYELEWSQSDQRVTRLTKESLGERVLQLGGRVFVEALQIAHVEYGNLLGLPRILGAASSRASTAEAMESFASTLRVYALKVTAHVEVDEPQTGELAKVLLDPLLHWKLAPRTVLDTQITYY